MERELTKGTRNVHLSKSTMLIIAAAALAMFFVLCRVPEFSVRKLNVIKYLGLMAGMLIAPGLVLLGLIRREYRIAQHLSDLLPLAFVFSLLFHWPLACAAYWLRLPWEIYMFVLCGGLFLLLVAYALWGRALDLSFEWGKDGFVLASAGAIGLVAFRCGGHFVGDATYHLASIQRLAGQDVISALAPFYKFTQTVPYSYAWNTWYFVVALLSRAGELLPIDLWDSLPPYRAHSKTIMPAQQEQ